MMMYRLLVILLGAVLVSGCASLEDQDFLASTSDFFDRAGQALRKVGEPTAKIKGNAEVQALFDQPYIDPLTKYLNQYEGDAARAEQVGMVREERERRCDVIFERYTAEPPTEYRVARYRAGYDFSCPKDVEAYALMLEEHEHEQQAAAEAEPEPVSAPSPAEEASSEGHTGKPPTATVSRELNDCYLLTAIRNFSDALKACRTPAKNGNVRAQTNMATIAYALQDYGSALGWAERAASESGDAANLLGRMYAAGQGVDQDPKIARQWFQQAANLGHDGAQAVLNSNVTVSAGDDGR